MTELEYLQSGCDNRHCKLTFKNGDVTYGVLTTFFPSEPHNFYLVRSPQMIELKKHIDNRDETKMKSMCTHINLETISKTELLDSIGQLLVNKNSEI